MIDYQAFTNQLFNIPNIPNIILGYNLKKKFNLIFLSK